MGEEKGKEKEACGGEEWNKKERWEQMVGSKETEARWELGVEERR